MLVEYSEKTLNDGRGILENFHCEVNPCLRFSWNTCTSERQQFVRHYKRVFSVSVQIYASRHKPGYDLKI